MLKITLTQHYKRITTIFQIKKLNFQINTTMKTH
jgi:hypothetical protein